MKKNCQIKTDGSWEGGSVAILIRGVTVGLKEKWAFRLRLKGSTGLTPKGPCGRLTVIVTHCVIRNSLSWRPCVLCKCNIIFSKAGAERVLISINPQLHRVSLAVGHVFFWPGVFKYVLSNNILSYVLVTAFVGRGAGSLGHTLHAVTSRRCLTYWRCEYSPNDPSRSVCNS